MSLFKIIKTVTIVLYYLMLISLFMLFFAVSGHAYIDPAALTYLIQVVAGLAIGGMTVLGVYWERIKKALKEAMNIDLESKKEIESDDIHVNY